MPKKLTNEDFLQKLKDNDVFYIPLEEYKGYHTKIKWMCDKNSRHIFDATPCNIIAGKHNCPYCTHRKAFIGETDLWTTNPEIAELLLNSEDGYKYLSTGGQKVDWVCPNCGNIIKDKIINNVVKQGLSCPYCSDGMSFSEKIIYELLSQLKCKFFYDKNISWSNKKRYDFYLPILNIIIECHGIQHYERSFLNYSKDSSKVRSLEDEVANDIYKKNLALTNGIEHYIELDCRCSNFDYIKKSIIDSELSVLFNLSIIDWNKCYKATITSNIILCANLWNNGMKDTKDISDYTGIHICSVISYLKKAAKIGLCDYVKNYKKNKNRYKKVLCVETGKVYECINDVKKDGYSNTHVSNCCNKRYETAYGLHWQFI